MSATTRPDLPRRRVGRGSAGRPADQSTAVITLPAFRPVDPAPERTGRPAPGAPRGAAPGQARGVRAWLRAHWLSLVVVTGLLLAVGFVHWTGYDRYPARLNDDEGTYVSQAWAVQYRHALAHYTYWYDHPPVGWITMAGYNWVTRAFERLPTAVSAGREFMVWVKLVSAALVYLLARRLGWHRLAAAGAVLLFGLSPLAVMFQRMVFLDNLAVMWTLAALALAASPKGGLAAFTGSAACFALAVLSKETAVVLFPALFLVLWQHTNPRTRRYSIWLFLTVLGGLVFFYPLYAILKNELFEGPGHVSLLWAIKWQLFGRPPSGSVLDSTSGANGVVRFWLDKDPWLLAAGALLVPLGLLFRRTRAVALALGIQVAMLLRNGYLPYPYVIAMLPFAALTIAGVAHQLCEGPARRLRDRGRPGDERTWPGVVATPAGQLAVVVAVSFALVAVTPEWSRGLHEAMTEDHSQPPKQAVDYVIAHIPVGSALLVDDNLWTDLVLNGFDPEPVWFYKLDLDPTIRRKYPNGWRDIDYVVMGDVSPTILRDLPLVTAAVQHSEVVASYGEGDSRLTVRKVIKGGRPG